MNESCILSSLCRRQGILMLPDAALATFSKHTVTKKAQTSSPCVLVSSVKLSYWIISFHKTTVDSHISHSLRSDAFGARASSPSSIRPVSSLLPLSLDVVKPRGVYMSHQITGPHIRAVSCRFFGKTFLSLSCLVRVD